MHRTSQDRIKLKLGVAGELEYELSEEGDETVFSLVNIDDGVLRPIDTLYSNEYRGDDHCASKDNDQCGYRRKQQMVHWSRICLSKPIAL